MCFLPGIIVLPYAVLELDLMVFLIALTLIVAGWSLILAPSVRRFFAFQQSRKRLMLAEDRAE